MIKAIPAILLLVFAGGCASSACLNPSETHWTRQPVVVPFAKIARGTANIVKSPFDIPATISRASRESDNFAYGLFSGTAEGIGNTIIRALAGVVEIATFPLIYDSEPLYERALGQRSYYEAPLVP